MNQRIIKIAKQLFADIVNVENKQYENAMYNYYKDNKQFVDYTLQQDKFAERVFKQNYPQAVTRTLTNGNVFLKYIETNEVIAILALLSKSGKLKKEDMFDANQILTKLVSFLQQGKRIETSANSKSLALLKRLKKLNNNIKIRKVGDFGNIMNVDNWSHYIVYI